MCLVNINQISQLLCDAAKPDSFELKTREVA